MFEFDYQSKENEGEGEGVTGEKTRFDFSSSVLGSMAIVLVLTSGSRID